MFSGSGKGLIPQKEKKRLTGRELTELMVTIWEERRKKRALKQARRRRREATMSIVHKQEGATLSRSDVQNHLKPMWQPNYNLFLGEGQYNSWSNGGLQNMRAVDFVPLAVSGEKNPDVQYAAVPFAQLPDHVKCQIRNPINIRVLKKNRVEYVTLDLNSPKFECRDVVETDVKDVEHLIPIWVHGIVNLNRGWEQDLVFIQFLGRGFVDVVRADELVQKFPGAVGFLNSFGTKVMDVAKANIHTPVNVIGG